MNPRGYPITVRDQKIGEIDRIEDRGGGRWIVHWHITDVEMAQRVGVDVLPIMVAGDRDADQNYSASTPSEQLERDRK